jgi:hypothetical protein
MERERRRHRGLRSFVLGGLVGASAVAAAVRRSARRRRAPRQTAAGLAAFESAPCYQELLERESDGAVREAAAERSARSAD